MLVCDSFITVFSAQGEHSVERACWTIITQEVGDSIGLLAVTEGVVYCVD